MSARVTLIGTVGRDPEYKVSAKGNLYAQFSIATWTGKKGEDRWWKVLAYGPLSEQVANIVRRGSYVEVEGKFEYSEREWQGKRYQDFTCFCERITEKEKPTPKVPTPQPLAEMTPEELLDHPTAWQKGAWPEARDSLDRENHYSSGQDQKGMLGKIPF